jgi:heme/copper-type cytochrome/quinol oxidase subunit 2
MTTWLNLTLQDRASPVIEQLIFFHDHALIIILIIITTVFYTMIRIIQNKQTRRFILEGQIIETVWTIAPAIILVFIAIPSLWLLYIMDEIHNPVFRRSYFVLLTPQLKIIKVAVCCIISGLLTVPYNLYWIQFHLALFI